MASLTVAQLLTPSTEAQSLAKVLALLDSIGFPATAWQSGGIARTMIQLIAKLHSDLTLTVQTITQGRFNDEARGPWLTLFSDSHYDNQRIAAVRTVLSVTLFDQGSAGPFALNAQQVVIADVDGHTFRNQGADTTLPQGGTRTLDFQAEVAGAASSGGVPLRLVTALAGVIVQTSEVTTPGVDEEQDPKLQTRNRTKWATLSYAAPEDAYRLWALSAAPAITRAWPDATNPRGPGTLDVYIAGVSGALTSTEETAVLDYINGTGPFVGAARRPLDANVHCISATNLTVTITGTVFTSAAYDSAVVLDSVIAAIDALFQSIDIGGTRDHFDNGYVMLAQVYRAAMMVPGVVNFFMTAPLTDVPLSVFQVAVPDTSALTVQTI